MGGIFLTRSGHQVAGGRISEPGVSGLLQRVAEYGRPSSTSGGSTLDVGPRTGRFSLRVLMVAGGTGGHIFPALSVADELRSRWRHCQPTRSVSAGEIQFLGTRRGLESRLIPASGFGLRTVAAAALKGISGTKKLRNLLILPRSAIESARVLHDFRPHVVVGVGGYLAGPVMLEASLSNLPTVLIEPNAVPGFTNRVLAPVIRAAAVGFEEAARFYGSRASVTGLPVRKEFGNIAPKQHIPPYTVLVSGGSQGSAAINACLMQTLPLLAAVEVPLRFIHQTGEHDLDRVRAAYSEQGVKAETTAFIEDMPRAFAEADLIIARSGALTVGELAASGKAALLIPFPAATDQHQLENARVLERAGGARVIEQAKLTPQGLLKEMTDILLRPGRLREMERGARSLARLDAAERIADLVEDLAFGRRPSTAVDGRP
jgi:UDP-N-acetylglucosamine--N-acetylmuramyl-(pentapeptide) pyrophosphoryl-undecaprenol N-acetylglucosamine transferase